MLTGGPLHIVIGNCTIVTVTQAPNHVQCCVPTKSYYLMKTPTNEKADLRIWIQEFDGCAVPSSFSYGFWYSKAGQGIAISRSCVNEQRPRGVLLTKNIPKQRHSRSLNRTYIDEH